MKFTKKPPLNEGETKEVRRFAFFPTKINENTTVWLEHYIECFRAEKVLRAYPTAVGMYGIWLAWDTEWVIEFVSKEKKVIFKN